MRMTYFEDDGFSKHVETRMKEAEAIRRDFFEKAPVDRVKAHLRNRLKSASTTTEAKTKQ